MILRINAVDFAIVNVTRIGASDRVKVTHPNQTSVLVLFKSKTNNWNGGRSDWDGPVRAYQNSPPRIRKEHPRDPSGDRSSSGNDSQSLERIGAQVPTPKANQMPGHESGGKDHRGLAAGRPGSAAASASHVSPDLGSAGRGVRIWGSRVDGAALGAGVEGGSRLRRQAGGGSTGPGSGPGGRS